MYLLDLTLMVILLALPFVFLTIVAWAIEVVENRQWDDLNEWLEYQEDFKNKMKGGLFDIWER